MYKYIKKYPNILMKCHSPVIFLTHQPFYRTMSRYSSLSGHNPMFPMKQTPDHVIDTIPVDNGKHKQENTSNDILSKHGGKIAIISLILTIGELTS